MALETTADIANLEHQPIDRFGALASTACAIHCVLSASLPEVIGAFGLGALLGHETEWGFTLVALVLAAAALVSGWRKHRSLGVVSLLGAGIAALLLARFLEDALGEPVGVALGILAGAMLVAGHFSNQRASCRARLARA